MYHKYHIQQGSTAKRVQALKSISSFKKYGSVNRLRVSYQDEPIVDDVFFITYIGRYHNKHHFLAGTTSDINSTKFMTTQTFPVYDFIYEVPIDRHVYASCKLFEYTSNLHAVRTPIVDLSMISNSNDRWMMVIDEYAPIYDIMKKADEWLDVGSRFRIE